jgi:hypothetical protein
MSYRYNPKNSTYMLMRQQENMHFAKRIKSVKPTVDNRAPKNFKHLKIKQSKSDKFRKREVDYQNKILLSKMMHILRRRNEK